TWKKITSGIPDGAFTRVIREDPNRRGLLYAGTETGLYVSFDDGENWQSLQLNLPIVPITDLVIHQPDKDPLAAPPARALGAAEAAAPVIADEEGFFGGGPSRIPAEAGLNRFIWDLRYPDASRFPGLIMWAGQTSGPRAVPGTYQVRLTADGQTLTQSFELKKDPRLETTQADFNKQFDLLIKIRDK